MRADLLTRIIQRITSRSESLFRADLERNSELLHERLNGEKVLVIGGAGTIGFSYIKALLQFPIAELHIIDVNENGLAEVIRDIRSSSGLMVPRTLKTYPFSFASPMAERLLKEEGPFGIVANFAAIKHVRSEKDMYCVQSMFENNFANANDLLAVLERDPPKRYFSVSTDKAANPVSMMGASKRLMEDVLFAYGSDFKVSTARFANVAFSNGSLPASFFDRFDKSQPLVCPVDIKRFFVSPAEAGELCLIANVLAEQNSIFVPKLDENDLIPMQRTVEAFLAEQGYELLPCTDEQDAKRLALDAHKTKKYPVLLIPTDTSGEKPYEEFFTEGEILDREAFNALNIIINPSVQSKDQVGDMVMKSRKLFQESTISRTAVKQFLGKHVAHFDHIDRGKSLDSKM